MRMSAAMIATLAVLGCANDLPQMAYENQTKLLQLKIGMTKPAVVQLMGEKSAQTHDGPVANPFRTETFRDKAGAQYDIYYYVTQKNRAFQPLNLGQATPLVFKNDVLQGWGIQAVTRAKRQQDD